MLFKNIQLKDLPVNKREIKVDPSLSPVEQQLIKKGYIPASRKTKGGLEEINYVGRGGRAVIIRNVVNK